MFLQASDVQESLTRFDQNHKIIQLYVGSAQSYIQISTAVLALSVTFIDKIWTARTAIRTRFLIAAWLLLLASVLAGGIYQYSAIGFVDKSSIEPGYSNVFLDWLRVAPGVFYGLMLICFHAAVACLLIHAVRIMRAPAPSADPPTSDPKPADSSATAA